MTRVAIALALTALVVASFVARWHVLADTPWPVGVDGFFYPLQVRSLLEHGSLAYPASPLTFWWMTPFAAATDPIVGAKLGAALGGALVAVPAYAVGARLGRSWAAGLVAAALAAGSAGSAYLSIEFVKQGIGVTVGLTALWLVLRALEAPTPRRAAAALAGIAATLLAHKLAALLVVVVAAHAALYEARTRLRGRRLIYAYVAAAAAVLLLVGLGLAMPQRFVSGTDVALVGHAFTRHAQWADPALATHGFTLHMEYEALLACIVSLAAAVLAYRRRDVVALAIAALGIVLAIPWLDVTDPQGLAFRARVIAFVPLALSAAVVAGALVCRHKVVPVALCVLAALLGLRALRERRDGIIVAHPAMVAAVLAATDQLPHGATAIVPERHIAFMLAYLDRADVSLRPERVPYAHRVRVMPLAFMSEELQQALDAARADPTVAAPPIGLHPRHRNGLVLVEEPTWDWLLARLPGPLRRHYARWPTI
ncbi:MAG: glycosyltransferase family 39 protein [Deltaproteobacteria bacterium]|nr:glycosyltransferase family 39 protein [Deltaproteobacteria bacterium]